MIMNDDTWHLVRNVPKVSNFLGTKDKPIAISEREVSKLLQDITEGTLSVKIGILPIIKLSTTDTPKFSPLDGSMVDFEYFIKANLFSLS